MKKIMSILIIASLLLSIVSVAFAKEPSSTDSRWWVKTYNDLNGNNAPDDGEEVTNIDVKWGRVSNTTCSSVADDAQIDAYGTFQSPFFMASSLSCHYFLVGQGVMSVTNYSARKTSVDSQDLNPDLWIKLPCKTCKAFLPVMLHAWSGQ